MIEFQIPLTFIVSFFLIYQDITVLFHLRRTVIKFVAKLKVLYEDSAKMQTLQIILNTNEKLLA